MKDSTKGNTVMRQLAPYLSLGSQLAASVLVMGGLGWLMDSWLECSPIGLIAGLVIGSIAGFAHFLRSVQRLLHRTSQQTGGEGET